MVAFCQKSSKNSGEKKVLVAYFSCTGNTRQIAEKIAKAANADLYEITPEVAYTAADLDYRNEKSRCSVEMNDRSSRPKIAGKVENMADYDLIYVGFPIWWGITPTIINTFMESYDFSGKNVALFCTSGSQDIDGPENYLKSTCSEKINWVSAKRFETTASMEVVKTWVDKH